MVLKRIERAITRLETAARQAAHEPHAHWPAQRMDEIEATNTRLREAIEQSLRQIDDLIARHGMDLRQ